MFDFRSSDERTVADIGYNWLVALTAYSAKHAWFFPLRFYQRAYLDFLEYQLVVNYFFLCSTMIKVRVLIKRLCEVCHHYFRAKERYYDRASSHHSRGNHLN